MAGLLFICEEVTKTAIQKVRITRIEKPADTPHNNISTEMNHARDFAHLGNRIPEASIGDFSGPLPPRRSARKGDCLSAKREFRLCSVARRSRVEKCPARGGSDFQMCTAGHYAGAWVEGVPDPFAQQVVTKTVIRMASPGRGEPPGDVDVCPSRR